MNSDGIICFIQEDKSHRWHSATPPYPQLIAEGIAAFQMNNEKRAKKDLLPMESEVIFRITMVKTFLTFFKIVITSDFSFDI